MTLSPKALPLWMRWGMVPTEWRNPGGSSIGKSLMSPHELANRMLPADMCETLHSFASEVSRPDVTGTRSKNSVSEKQLNKGTFRDKEKPWKCIQSKDIIGALRNVTFRTTLANSPLEYRSSEHGVHRSVPPGGTMKMKNCLFSSLASQ